MTLRRRHLLLLGWLGWPLYVWDRRRMQQGKHHLTNGAPHD